LFFLRFIFCFSLLNILYFNLPGVIHYPAGKGTIDDGWSAAGDFQLLLNKRLNRADPAANEIAAER